MGPVCGHFSSCGDTAEGARLSRSAQVARSLWCRFAAVVDGSRRRSVAVLAIAAIVGAAVASLALGFDLRLAFELLREHHRWLLGFVAGAPALASMLFMV